MRNFLASVHRPARIVLIVGWLTVAAIVAVSAVLYIGAGAVFDYYSSVAFSENLLAFSRPVAVAVCAFSLLIEYRSRQKNNRSS